jgi:hypothetical protein
VTPTARNATRTQRDEDVVEDVHPFLHGPCTVAVSAGRNELRGLLAELFEAEIPIGEEAPSVTARGTSTRRGGGSPFGKRAIERTQRIGGERGISKAGSGAAVTGRSCGVYAREHGVAVAVGREQHDPLPIATGGAFVPEPARPRVVVHLAGLDGAFECLAISVRDHQYRTASRILRDDGHEAVAFVEVQRRKVEHQVPPLWMPSRDRISAARAALVATTPAPPKADARPHQSVKTPPASVMTGSKAAASHGERIGSVISSARPVATSR